MPRKSASRKVFFIKTTNPRGSEQIFRISKATLLQRLWNYRLRRIECHLRAGSINDSLFDNNCTIVTINTHFLRLMLNTQYFCIPASSCHSVGVLFSASQPPTSSFHCFETCYALSSVLPWFIKRLTLIVSIMSFASNGFLTISKNRFVSHLNLTFVYFL